MKFGIIGYGRFGRLLAEALQPHGDVKIYDTALKLHPLAEVLKADIVFLVVPISNFADTCQAIQSQLNPQAILIDCCSVKVYPVKVMQQYFPQQTIIATHPMFGPDSVARSSGVAGHQIVMCPVRCDAAQEKQIRDLFKNMGLHVTVTTPEEHDMQMANSQGLVHFIGRGLASLELHPQEMATPDFAALLAINHMVIHDSYQLFLDMHRYNPYTKDIRKKFLHQLMAIDWEINSENVND